MVVRVTLGHPTEEISDEDIRNALLRVEMHFNEAEPYRLWVEEVTDEMIQVAVHDISERR